MRFRRRRTNQKQVEVPDAHQTQLRIPNAVGLSEGPRSLTSSKDPEPLKPEDTVQATVKKRNAAGEPALIEINGIQFISAEALEELNKPAKFGWIYTKLIKMADMILERFGTLYALKVSKLNSKIDIATSYCMFWIGAISTLAVTAYLAVYLTLAYRVTKAAGSMTVPLEEITRRSPTLAQMMEMLSFSNFSKIGVVLATAAVAYTMFKSFLDNSQKVLMNQLLRRVKLDSPEKYMGMLVLEKKYREYDDAERLEQGFTSSIVSRIPGINIVAGIVAKEYYNLKYEKRQLAAIEEMEAYLKSEG